MITQKGSAGELDAAGLGVEQNHAKVVDGHTWFQWVRRGRDAVLLERPKRFRAGSAQFRLPDGSHFTPTGPAGDRSWNPGVDHGRPR